jgi:hypothetical protein
MPKSIAEHLADSEDKYAPIISKPSLQQYDNYQIHDLYCDDIKYIGADIKLFNNFLAVQRVSPYGAIECNFEAIAILYK